MNTTVATKEKAKDRRFPQPSARDEVGMNCLWCDTPFTPRQGGKPQRFCSKGCRTGFHAAARKWAEQAVARGELTVAELRKPQTCLCSNVHVSPGPILAVAGGQVPDGP